MSVTLEDALAGKHGKEARERAEAAVSTAVDQVAKMFAGGSIGGIIPAGTFATGGAINVAGMSPLERITHYGREAYIRNRDRA